MSDIKTIREANDYLASVGEKRHVFKNLKSAQVTVEQVRKRIAAKTVTLPAAVAPKATVPTISDLKAAISKEKNIGARIDILRPLTSPLQSSLKHTRTYTLKR